MLGAGSQVLVNGPVTAMALHKHGLFVASDDAKLHRLELKGATVASVVTMATAGAVTSLAFNPSHSRLAVGCAEVCNSLFHVSFKEYFQL